METISFVAKKTMFSHVHQCGAIIILLLPTHWSFATSY